MHKLPDLPYDYKALEKSIDAKTMEIHHGKHHQGYVNNLNKALESLGEAWYGRELPDLLRNLNEIPEAKRVAVRNHGGGHFNHSLFWSVMSPEGGGQPSGDLLTSIERSFKDFDTFKAKFSQLAAGQFGSGWAWLNVKNGDLELSSTPNQDNPLMNGTGTPILGLDVWEHAYYLRYQNRRPDYIDAFWNVVNWPEVSRRYLEAR
jgi:Fe-Mn family superoxide dismutase